MFWIRKSIVKLTGKGKPYIEHEKTIPNKEFETMYELLKDAEKYDSMNETLMSENILEGLVNYIEMYIDVKTNKKIN